MKKILVVVFTLVSSFSYSQSKEDTSDWIEQNLNYYGLEKSISPDTDYRIQIKDGYFYMDFCDSSFGYCIYIYSRFPLNKIKYIEFEKQKFTDDGRFVDLTFTTFPNSIERKTDKALDYKIAPSMTEDNIRLSIEITKDGMQPRMEKALLHLVKLYSGNAKILKEPF